MKEQVAANLVEPFRIPIGPMYSRIIILAYVGNVLDSEVESGNTAITEKSELGVQEATVIESRERWQFDSDYRDSYYKVRPTGVMVHSGIDQSGTDEDLWVTQDLGNFTLALTASARANGATGSRWEVYTQALQPVSEPGLYA
jgi:hypothetical protein